ncbi:MAG: cupin domain-containing protein [Gammaproteobacteria bacterium]|nr:cupin domain-containing protein [Gammaproteobacteria bacterium]
MNEKLLVGQNIRNLRSSEGLSLRALAELSGLSTNAISLIERGDNSPTVSSLHSLANALRVPVTAFFEEHGDGQVVHTKKNRRPSSETAGVRMQSLGSGLPNQQIEPFLMTIESESSSTSSQITHGGEELVYVLKGALTCTIKEEEYRLEKGDSLLFLASQPHIYRNETSKAAQLLIVFQPMLGQLMAHQHYVD